MKTIAGIACIIFLSFYFSTYAESQGDDANTVTEIIRKMPKIFVYKGSEVVVRQASPDKKDKELWLSYNDKWEVTKVHGKIEPGEVLVVGLAQEGTIIQDKNALIGQGNLSFDAYGNRKAGKGGLYVAYKFKIAR